MKKVLISYFRRSPQEKDISLEKAKPFFSKYHIDIVDSKFPGIRSNSNWFRNLNSKNVRDTQNNIQTVISGEYYFKPELNFGIKTQSEIQTHTIRYDFTMTNGELKIDQVSLGDK